MKSAYSCSCYKPFCLGQDLHFFNGFPTEQICLWREHLYTGNMRHTGCFMILQPWQKAFTRVLASNRNAEWAAAWKSTTWRRTQCKSCPLLKQERTSMQTSSTGKKVFSSACWTKNCCIKFSLQTESNKTSRIIASVEQKWIKVPQSCPNSISI